MKKSNMKLALAALALTTVIGTTSAIAINAHAQVRRGEELFSAQSISGSDSSKEELSAGSITPYKSVIGGTAINEYATYAEYQNIDGSHEIRAWGYNKYGLLGNGDTDQNTKLGWAEATKVDLDMTGKTLKFMESLNDTIFVVLEDNAGGADEVWAWGNNDQGQLFIDKSTPFVTTPTRILEDKIPTWGSIVGIDASLGSTIVYFQGTEGQEFDPANYNNEDLWLYGAGDTSKDQDAKQGMFDKPLNLGPNHYFDSDANSKAYSMIYKKPTDEINDEVDTRVITWGDNSTYLLGTGDNLQPEEGYFVPYIHDEELAPEPIFWIYYETTILERVTAGEDNFIYGAASKMGDLFETFFYNDYTFATGSKEIDGGTGYYEGINLLENAPGRHWYEEPPTGDVFDTNIFSFDGIAAGDGFVSYLLNVANDDYDPDSAEYSILTTGNDDYGQLGNGSDDLEILPTFTDNTYELPWGRPAIASWKHISPDDYYNDDHSDIRKYLVNNKHTTLWTGSSNPDVESLYEMNAWGSNSNGIFDQYSDSNEPDQQSSFAFNTDLYNYDEIKINIIDGGVHSTSIDFTVDTTGNTDMINPNSYEIFMKANGEECSDDIVLNSFDNGIASFTIKNLSRDTNYDFEYSFNYHDETYKPAFSVKTTNSVAQDPIIKSVEFVSYEELDYYNSLEDYQKTDINRDVDSYGADKYTVDVKWDIEDKSEPGGEQTTLDKIVIIADETKKDGTVLKDKVFYEKSNPDWKGESDYCWQYLEEYSNYEAADWTAETLINPGSKLTNARVELYVNQLEDPIIQEMPDYTEPDLNKADAIYDAEILYLYTGYDSIEFEISTNLGKEIADICGRPTAEFPDVELTNLEFTTIDEKLTQENYEYDFPESTIYLPPSYLGTDYQNGNIYILMTGLNHSTSYNDLVINASWTDNNGHSYSDSIDVVNDLGIDLTTDSLKKPEIPDVEFNNTSTTSTSADFNWTILTEEPSANQEEAVINKVTIEDRKNGISYDVTEDLVQDSTDNHKYEGNSTIEGLTPETQYRFELKVNYSDSIGTNNASVESNSITFTTGDYEEALPPIINSEEATPGYDSITVDYSIGLPDPIANPLNRPTELYSVKLYINDDTEPVAISQDGDLEDTNGDGKITGTLTATGLEPETEYQWHIEVESNADTIVGEKHTITTTMLSAPNAPIISSTSLTPTDDYNTFRFDYTLAEVEPAAGQSPAFINSVEFVYKGKVIGQQSFRNDSTTSENGQPIPEEGFVGSFDVTGIDWNIDVSDAFLRVGYSGSSAGQDYSTDIAIDSLSSPSLKTEGVQPNIKRAQAATVGGFKQISSSEAVISYSVETPAVTLGTAAVEIEEIRIVDGTEVLARTTEHSGNILLTDLESNTLYSSLKLEVEYQYVRPAYDNNPGEVISGSSMTISKNVTPFKTLSEDEFSLSGNVQYVGYNNGDLEGELTLFDSNNAFIPKNFRVSVKEGTGDSAVRVEKTVQLTKIETIETDKADPGISTTKYKIVIKDVKEGVHYSSWKYTMSTEETPADEEWISFKIEDPITGNEFNTFYMPPNIINHNLIYIIVDVILLLTALGLTVFVILKVKNKDKKDDDKKDKAEKKTKAVKGGNNE